jgi:phosphohistidine swiveling domain-containing protein
MSFWFIPMAESGKTAWATLWPSVYGKFGDDRIVYVWEREEMDNLGMAAIEKVILNDATREKIWREYSELHIKLQKFAEEIFLKDKKGEFSFKNAQEKAHVFFDFAILLWSYGITPELANFGTPRYLQEKISKYIPISEINSSLEALLAPDRLSFHQQSEYELLKTAIGDRNFGKYAKNWYWVENSYFESKIISDKEFEQRVSCLTQREILDKISVIENYGNQVKKRRAEIVSKFSIPEEIARVSELLVFSIWWQDHRKGVAWWLNSLIDVFNKAVAHELKISQKDILYYRAEEWIKLFESKPNILPAPFLDERKNKSIFKIVPKKVLFEELHGVEVEKVEKELFKPTLYSDSRDNYKELKGVAVSRGKVRGRVKILLSPRLTSEMKNGEILVAPMTSPDYIVAMRKALAVITDVGGLMSHAAIVSRELGIPCIVGTKIATKVLKDGDEVEVDADNGLVKIIKS